MRIKSLGQVSIQLKFIIERMKENAKAAEMILTEAEIREIDVALNHMKMSDVFGGHK